MARVRAIMFLCLIASQTTDASRVKSKEGRVADIASHVDKMPGVNPFESAGQYRCIVRWAPGVSQVEAGEMEGFSEDPDNLKAQVVIPIKSQLHCSATGEAKAKVIFKQIFDTKFEKNTCKCVAKQGSVLSEMAAISEKFKMYKNKQCEAMDCWDRYFRLASETKIDSIASSEIAWKGDKNGTALKKGTHTLKVNFDDVADNEFWYKACNPVSQACPDIGVILPPCFGKTDAIIELVSKVLQNVHVDSIAVELLSSLSDRDQKETFVEAAKRIGQDPAALYQKYMNWLRVAAEADRPEEVSFEDAPSSPPELDWWVELYRRLVNDAKSDDGLPLAYLTNPEAAMQIVTDLIMVWQTKGGDLAGQLSEEEFEKFVKPDC